MIDFSDLALSPNESRAARNFLGLSQAQAAESSGLQGHKLKRFEAGNYVPDSQFLGALRGFYEAQGYDFRDDQSPGAKARAQGDVFPAGVVGDAAGSPGKTSGSPSGAPSKVERPKTANLQYVRIAPDLQSEQINRAFDLIEDNESVLSAGLDAAITRGFMSDGLSASTQAQAIALLRRLAENGVTYARLMGRDLLTGTTEADSANGAPAKQSATAAATVGDLVRQAMGDAWLAVMEGDKQALGRRKERAVPREVMQALLG